MTIEKFLAMATAQDRPVVRPTVEVKVKSAADQQKVVQTARKVIDTHREVFIALKDR